MEKIALITDSTCGLPKEYVEKYSVFIAHLKVIYKDAEYIDGQNITAEEVYNRLDTEVPTTSMPSVEDICTLYEEIILLGYTHAIILPISSGLSGTINSFRIAASQYEGQINSFVYDTKILSMPIGLMLIEAGKMIEQQRSFEYICSQIPLLREKIHMFFTVDTLEYLIKGGRIGKVSGSLGQMLNLKPIIMMDDDGKYTTYTKVRGSKQALQKLVDLMLEHLNKGKCKVLILTGNMIKEAQQLEQIFKKHINTTFLYSGHLTPVVGIHSGPKLIGVAVLEEF